MNIVTHHSSQYYHQNGFTPCTYTLSMNNQYYDSEACWEVGLVFHSHYEQLTVQVERRGRIQPLGINPKKCPLAYLCYAFSFDISPGIP